MSEPLKPQSSLCALVLLAAAQSYTVSKKRRPAETITLKGGEYQGRACTPSQKSNMLPRQSVNLLSNRRMLLKPLF